jgi:hypothetical protein
VSAARRRSGEGNSSVGDLLPGPLTDAGLVDVQCVPDDKTYALVPPYETGDQRALRDVIIANAASHRWTWSHQDAERYFLAGGGHAKDFEARCATPVGRDSRDRAGTPNEPPAYGRRRDLLPGLWPTPDLNPGLVRRGSATERGGRVQPDQMEANSR